MKKFMSIIGVAACLMATVIPTLAQTAPGTPLAPPGFTAPVATAGTGPKLSYAVVSGKYGQAFVNWLNWATDYTNGPVVNSYICTNVYTVAYSNIAGCSNIVLNSTLGLAASDNLVIRSMALDKYLWAQIGSTNGGTNIVITNLISGASTTVTVPWSPQAGDIVYRMVTNAQFQPTSQSFHANLQAGSFGSGGNGAVLCSQGSGVPLLITTITTNQIGIGAVSGQYK